MQKIIVLKQNVLELIYKEGNGAELNIAAHDYLFKQYKAKYRALLFTIVFLYSCFSNFWYCQSN